MNDYEKKMLGKIIGMVSHMEIKGVSIDSRNVKEGELFVALKGDRFDGHDFVLDAIKKGAWGALVERTALEQKFLNLGALKNILPVEDTLYALQEMAHLHRKKFMIPVVGITGSNGKTTTREMLASILKLKGPVLKNEGNLNNHIGVPLTLLKMNDRHWVGVIEMGMSAPGEIDTLTRLAMPTIGVITNIGPAHLEFFGTTDKVAQAKGELLDNLKSEASAVLNADDAHFSILKKKFAGRLITFSIANKADVTASNVRQEKEYSDMTITTEGVRINVRLRAVGIHNVYNALAATAAALAVGVTIDVVKFGLDDFLPVAGRSEIKKLEGRTVLADYYNANPASMEAAIKTLVSLKSGMKAIAVIGDMLELGEKSAEAHREIGRTAARNKVDLLITVGEQGTYVEKGALEAGMKAEQVLGAISHENAGRLLKQLTHPGDVILIKGSRGMKMEKILEAF
jgi:UDP-N-acetylmuramoyl-tripeptide--D-alanyl-D-alanine ligase